MAPESGAKKTLQSRVQRMDVIVFISAAYRSLRCAVAVTSIRVNLHDKQFFWSSQLFFQHRSKNLIHDPFRHLLSMSPAYSKTPNPAVVRLELPTKIGGKQVVIGRTLRRVPGVSVSSRRMTPPTFPSVHIFPRRLSRHPDLPSHQLINRGATAPSAAYHSNFI